MADLIYDYALDEWGLWGTGPTYKMVAMKSTYVPNRTHHFWSEIKTHECSTAGYAKATLLNLARTVNTTLHRITYDASDPVLGNPAGTQEIGGFVLYKLASPEDNSVLMAWYEVTPFNTDGTYLVPIINASGLHYVDEVTT